MTSLKPGWHMLSESDVSLKSERKQIEVIGADKFSALKFISTNGKIRIDTLEIIFENGPHKILHPAKIIEKNGDKLVTHLNNKDNSLKSVEMVYNTIDGAKEAHIQIWGLKPEKKKK